MVLYDLLGGGEEESIVFSSVCGKCSALRFSWVAIWESWRERENCRDAWAGFVVIVVEVGGLHGRRVLVPVGASLDGGSD